MLNMRIIVFVLGLSFPALIPAQLVTIQGPQLTPPPSNTPPEQKCVVEGRVTNLLTGESLKKATIHLTRSGSASMSTDAIEFRTGASSLQGYSATSAADGSFRIEGIEPGDYSLSGERNGFLHTEYGAKGPMRSGTVLALRPGQQMTNIILGLNPQAVITGKVVDEDGDPVSDAQVQVLRRTWQRGKRRVLPQGGTNANDVGEFRIADLSPGRYYICASVMSFRRSNEESPPPGKPDMRPIRTCHPGAVTLEAATPIDIAADQDLSGLEIRLHSAQTYHVRGKVVGDLPKREAQDVDLILASRDEGMFFFGTNQASMNKDRTFDMAGVAPGSYTLHLFFMSGNIQGAAHQPIDVGQGDVNDVIVGFSPAGSLHGQARLEGMLQTGVNIVNLANVSVYLSPADLTAMLGPTPRGTSKSDGSFVLDNVFPGKYYVRTNAPAGTYLKSMRLGQQEILGKELDLSQAVSGELEIVFHYGAAEVNGTLQLADRAGSSSTGRSTPMPATSIVLVPDVLNADGSGIYYGSANQFGSFTVKGVPPGHYHAYAFENANRDELQDPDVLRQLENRATDVEVKENDLKQIQLAIISSDDLQQIFARLGIDSAQ
jgi:Carboxypeptidase regulatory-like domain